MKKKLRIMQILAALLALILAFTTMPFSAFAAEPVGPAADIAAGGDGILETDDGKEDVLEEGINAPSEEDTDSEIEDAGEQDSDEDDPKENIESSESEENSEDRDCGEESEEASDLEDEASQEEVREEALAELESKKAATEIKTIEIVIEDIKDPVLKEYASEVLNTTKNPTEEDEKPEDDGKLIYACTEKDGKLIPLSDEENPDWEKYDQYSLVEFLDLSVSNLSCELGEELGADEYGNVIYEDKRLTTYEDMKLFRELTTYLYLDGNSIGSTSIDLTANTALKSLTLDGTGISSLDNIAFYSKDNMIRFDLSDNDISTLDLSEFKIWRSSISKV